MTERPPWLQAIDLYPGRNGFRGMYLAREARDIQRRWQNRALIVTDRVWMASNPSTVMAVVDLLVKDDEPSVREQIALHPKVTSEGLWVLAEDSEPSVRVHVAKSKKVTQEILTRLASDRADSVRCAVAQNVKTPPEVLERLAGSKHVETVWAVFANPKTPEHVRKALAPIQARVLGGKWRDLAEPLYKGV